MSHIVKYRGQNGKTDYHHTDDIHDAVSFVEQLRNDQNVDGAQIFRLEEVNFDYRPYYRVELKAGEPMLSSAPSAAKPAVAPAAAPAAAQPAKPATTQAAATPATPVREVPKPEPELVSVPARTAPASAAAPKPTPVADTASESDVSSVGARRGLFGR